MILEYIVIGYHSVFFLVGATLLLDYVLATDKFTEVREFLGVERFTPLFGTELIIAAFAGLSLITNVIFFWYVAQAATILVLAAIICSTVWALICKCIISIRNKNIKKRDS